jgi:pimeloyl-ACP methyl ester carboxylesterase
MALGQPTPLRSERTTEDPDFTAWTTPVLTLALRALEERVLLWGVSLGGVALWVYTVFHPELFRIVAASLYSATVLWPFLWRRRGGG